TNVKHNRHPNRPPRIRAATFPLRLPHLHPDRLDGDGLHLPLHAHPDRTALYAVRVPQCRVSPRVIVSSVVLSASVPVRSLRSSSSTVIQVICAWPSVNWHCDSTSALVQTAPLLCSLCVTSSASTT